MPLYIVLGQQRACMPVYIGKSGDLVRCYRCLTDTQTTEYRATQLLYSIQFKLSHAIKNRIFIMHSRIRILHLMFMFSHPLKPTEDWTFSILYFVSEHRKIISMISCPFQNLPIKESLQSPSSFRSSLVERRQELHPRVV